MKGKVRVLLVDDHAFVRKAVRRLIDVHPDMQVCAEAEDSAHALQAVQRHHPDVVVVDLALQREDGLALTRLLRAKYERLPVLILSIHKESLFAENALKAGASGYLMKSDAAEHLVDAIQAVARDQIYVSDVVRQAIFSKIRADALKRGGGGLAAESFTPTLQP